MEHETHKPCCGSADEHAPKKDLLIPTSIIVSTVIFAGAWIYVTGLRANAVTQRSTNAGEASVAPPSALEEAVLPTRGIELPVVWGDLGMKLTSAGVIDEAKFRALYGSRFTKEYETLLLGKNEGTLRMTSDNAGYILNLFWALGLANKNPILDSGEMRDPRYGGAQNFASTGGWTVARGDAMEHYSTHSFVVLTAAQQALVDRVSRNIYRPCCDNATHFPDCNHGMAMLGFLELMASQGVNEADMYKAALAVNAYWFPDNYLTIATYMKSKGIPWNAVDPQEILGANYSSILGYKNIAAKIPAPSSSQGGSGCGVSAGASAQTPVLRRQSSGCGID